MRHYAKVSLREAPLSGRLANWQRRRLIQYIDDNLAHGFTLKDLAQEARISVSSLVRKFLVECRTPTFFSAAWRARGACWQGMESKPTCH